MKKTLILLCLLLTMLAASGCGGGKNTLIAESDETVHTWIMARRFQAEGRYELAQQYYSLALSTARTQSSVLQLQHDLDAVQLQIRAMR